MGAFKIQTDLDLSGFNLLNFCIQSYTDLENVPNLGLGRKLFFTGNSTDEKNLREVIWDGVEWKAAAYLDDIEAITNGEGSLGTRVKALEDMLGLEDVTDVIDTWNDVKEFFANVDEGLNLMDLLDGKAEWAERIPDLSFKHIGYGYAGQGFWTSGPALSFGANANYFGQIQMDIMPVPTIKIRSYNKGYGEWQTLLHKGNYSDLIGDYYLKTDGSNIMAKNAYIAWNSGADGNDVSDWSTVTGNGLRIISSCAENTGAPTPYATALHVRGRYYFKLASRGGSVDELYYQNSNHDWKTIAFTDSDINGNAATATKLAKAVSLWGNEFDGTQGISGNIFLPSGKGIRWMLGEVELDNISVGTDGAFNLGYGSAINGYASYINGTPIYLRTGKDSLTTAMTITEEGNVLVGTGTAHENAQLFSGGLTHVYGYAATPTLGSAPSTGLIVGSEGNGLAMWSTSGAGSFMQAEYFDGTSTALPLNLNPLGGAVNVGDGGLSVAGIASVATTLTVGASDGTSVATIYLQRASNNYIWANKAGGTLHLGVADSGNTSNANASLSIASDKIYPGIRNNAVSLGRTEYRWSDVYSVSGNFSGIITVGGGLTSSKPDGGTYPRWRITHEAGGLYIQSCTYDGKATNGILNLTGINNEGLTNFNVKATVSNFSKRVLIGGATDDGETVLQVNNTMSIGASKTDYGLRFNRNTIYAWIPENHAYGHNAQFGLKVGDTVLGVFGHHREANGDYYAFIGTSHSSPWFTINSTESNFNVLTNFNAGALIPTGQKMTFGADGPTMEYDADANAIKVTGNIYATGTMASGGKAAEGEGDTGGGGNANVYSDVLEGVITQEWEVGNPFQKEDVIVSLYMWNTDESRWEMVLADIGVTSENIWVTFGRPTSTTDKYMAVVMG